MPRNAISANPEHYIFKIFRGTLLESLETFSRCRVAQFFHDRLSPKQKILDRLKARQILSRLIRISACISKEGT